MLKRAQLYYRSKCPGAEEAKNFLEEHGVKVVERDITQKPLTKKELGAVLGYLNPKHYLDTTSAAFKKKKLDKQIPARSELLEIIIENPDLLRNPIIRSGRLLTFGNNRQQLIQMFQIAVSDNGSGEKKGASRRERR